MISFVKKVFMFGVPVVFIVVGSILFGLWSILFQKMLNSELILTNSSKSYSAWKDVPLPLYMKFYMFNWTNAADVLANSSVQPEFTELGPYVFRERHKRVNITWNDNNNTLSYQQIRTWYFEQQMSNGTLNDKITTMNLVLATMVYMMRYKNPWIQFLLGVLVDDFSSLYVTRSVRELLFDGYDDKLLDILRKLNPNSTIHIPFKKVGYFVGRNNSPTFDGIFNMFTGASNLNQLGLLTQWNYQNFTDFYGSPCSNVRGSSGDLWPPLLHNHDKIQYLFIPDLCFALPLEAVNSTVVHGLQATNLAGTVLTFDTGHHSPASQCQCEGECQPPGTLNTSSCHYGSPIFVSFPHFFLADSIYRQNIHGMKPEQKQHEFLMSIDPVSGVPLEVNARLQLNILVKNNPYIRLFQKFPTSTYYPILWFDQHVSIPHQYLSEVRELVEFSTIGSSIMLSIVAFGIFLLLVSLMVILQLKYHPKEREERQERLLTEE